ncbi:MAG: AAA family ATPase, partial [Methylococcaceae bacterium]|nr:AAA family ATPase [Methylococcaceae bacterium]
MQTFSLFVSSPGDVDDERRRAEQVIRKLQTEFDRYIRLEPIFWEHQPQSSQQHFQEQIKKLPSATDLVVCILWSRLGTRLPPDKFQRPDGTHYNSGTEFEFEDAVDSYRQHKTPDLWVYRKTADVLVSLNDPNKADKEAQKAALDKFLDHWLGSPQDHFKAGFNSFTDADDFERQLTAHLHDLLLARCPQYQKDTDELPAWTRDESPYRGLAYFDLNHAAVFFGRSAAVHAVLAQLNSQAAVGKPFVLVLGASGAGKSSLLRAGLLHALVAERRVDKVDLWRYAILRPDDAPDGDWLRGLAAALLAETALPELAGAGFADVASLSAQLAQHPEGLAGALAHALAAAADRLRLERAWNFTPNARLVLLIDPLEEIFRAPTDTRTVLTDAEKAEQLRQQNALRDRFLTAVQALAETGLVWILAGLRSEYYPQAAGHPVLNTLKAGAGQYDLAMPDETELAEIIRYPARAAGMAFELRAGRRLDAQLLKDTANNPNALPLLEFTLDALYQLARQRGDNTLSFDDYHIRLGGLDGAITLAAETAVSQLGDGNLDAVRDVFRQLVDLDNGKALRRRAPLSDFQADPLQWQVVQAFINARLLSSSDSGDTHTATVEPVHEALLRTWPQLLAWLAEDQDILAIRSRMEELAANWQAASRNEGYLLNAGKQEQDATQLLKQPWLKLPPTAQDFIDLSLRKIRRRRWALRWTIGGVTAVFVLGAAGFSAVNYEQRKKAETAAGLALQVVSRLTDDLPDRLSTVPGTLQILQETFEQNADLLKQIDGLRGMTAESERERGANLQRHGDQRLAMGDLAGALTSYQACLAIFEKLIPQDPDNTDWQRNLSVSYEKIGDIVAQQGDQNAA